MVDFTVLLQDLFDKGLYVIFCSNSFIGTSLLNKIVYGIGDSLTSLSPYTVRRVPQNLCLLIFLFTKKLLRWIKTIFLGYLIKEEVFSVNSPLWPFRVLKKVSVFRLLSFDLFFQYSWDFRSIVFNVHTCFTGRPGTSAPLGRGAASYDCH